jgi:hypothetical protein
LGKTFEEPWGSAVVAECKIGLIGKEESWRVEMDKDFGRRPRDGRGQIELISAHLSENVNDFCQRNDSDASKDVR